MPVVKHSYLVKDADEIPRVTRESFHIATTGRPGPVLIDLPKDITATINKLKGNADVKKEVAALRILGAAKRKLYGKTISARKSGFRALERLADQQSETQAGQEAQQLIKSLGMP